MDTQGKIEGKILHLLQEGHQQSAIAKAVGKSSAAILKRARKYVMEGKLERIAKARYRKPINQADLPPLKPVEIFTHPPIMLPHKFGALLAQVGKPKLAYDKYGKAEEKTALWYIQYGKHKAQIWLYAGFQGQTPDSIIESGKSLIRAIIAEQAAKHRITLTLLRFYTDIEWVDISKERSKATARGIGIRKGEQVVVAGAIHKLDKVSHEDSMEFNALPNGDSERPTEHARIRHNLYSGEYERRFDKILEGFEKVLGVVQEIKAWKDMQEAKK